MLRPSRPLTIALLWLAIVLLPLRAWAATAMPVAMAGAPVMMMQIADDAQPDGAPACHGQQHADDDGAPQACSLCGVCHSAFAALPGVQASLPALPQARPAGARVPAVEPAALAGPERPPRLPLA
jgi:cytochrome c553